MLRPSLYDFGLVKFAAILPVALFLSVPGLRAQDISTPLRAEFVYVANSIIGLGTVSGYTINPATGVLAAFAGSPFAAGEEPLSVAITFRGTRSTRPPGRSRPSSVRPLLRRIIPIP
ncbi:MAG: hypothetical protein WB696_11125 [Chthoniobacterales bacterium]